MAVHACVTPLLADVILALIDSWFDQSTISLFVAPFSAILFHHIDCYCVGRWGMTVMMLLETLSLVCLVHEKFDTFSSESDKYERLYAVEGFCVVPSFSH